MRFMSYADECTMGQDVDWEIVMAVGVGRGISVL